MNLAAVALDDGARDPEAEAGTALTFGGEEGLTEAAPNFERNAAAIVANGDANAADAGIGPASRAADAQAEAAVDGGGFNRVCDQVGEDLAHLAGINEGRFVAAILALDADVLLGDTAGVQGEHFFEEFVDVGVHGSRRFAGKLESLSADLCDAFELALGEGEVVDDRG